ncbi:hypothetical protein PG993_003652 [Apiospora rasikravindrae]|uniref:Heterokaryon incompatibility domain-containing protein n=1 Tax=Apiospora rasikravindrae TaxID=990691 RepID=A0ABR1U0N0_9PEZI
MLCKNCLQYMEHEYPRLRGKNFTKVFFANGWFMVPRRGVAETLVAEEIPTRTVQVASVMDNRKSCFLCHLILSKMGPLSGLEDRWGDKIKMPLVSASERGLTLALGSGYFTLEVVPYPTQGFRLLGGNSTGSPEALVWVRECLQQCVQCHTGCRVSAPAEQWRPTRLVQFTDSRAKLVTIHEDVYPSAPYATLSHCWGGASIVCCTLGTIDQMRSNIDIEALPLTFRHALRVIAAIGIDYIWIDSLCIIQDSAEDWGIEAMTMTKVYANATVNLAATMSVDSHGGLFRTRNPAILSSGDFSPIPGMDRFTAVSVDSNVTSHWNTKINEAPLNSRGWVVQERVLSRRIIHFTSEQLVWTCADRMAWELCDPVEQGAKSGHDQYGLGLIYNPLTRHSAWFRLVERYTRGKLTRPSDRLIAISGVIMSVRDKSKERNVYGLWEQNLEIELCWSIPTLRRTSASRTGIAPSWSWASTGETGVNYSFGIGKDGFPPSLLAWVTHIEGVIRLSSQGEEGSTGGDLTPQQRDRGRIRLRCVCNAVQVAGYANAVKATSRSHDLITFTADPDTDDVVGRQDLVATFICREYYTVEWSHEFKAHGLLLQPTDRDPGTYVRCGSVFVSRHLEAQSLEQKQAWRDYISPAGKGHISCVDYDEGIGHLIDII